jgi:phage gp29-like protein
MGRYKKFHPNRMVRMPLASGGTMNFYEPDNLLSEQMTQKQAMTTEIGIRETAWNYYRVLGYLPNPSETLRKMGKDIAEYKYLLEDSHVNGCMSSRKAGTLSLNWSLDKNDCDTKQYQTIKAIFDGWPMNNISSEFLNCTFFGYQPGELVWERVRGLWLPEKLEPKDCDWFRFDDTNELRYLTKRNMVTGEPLPQYRFVVARYRPSYERPYGRPLGSVVYWPVKFRHTGIRVWTSFCEKYGMPWVKASYPLGAQASRVQEMINTIESTIQDGIVAYPTEYNIEALKMNDTASSDIFEKYIAEMNQEISIGILGQTLTTTVGKEGGALATAKVHATVRDDIVNEDKSIIELVFNTLISWMYEINWGNAKTRPKFKLMQQPQPTKDDAQATVYLRQSGIAFTKEYYQNRFGLLDTEFDIAPPLGALGTQGVPVESGAGTEDAEGATAGLTHEANDTATNSSTYESTKDSVKNMTRR